MKLRKIRRVLRERSGRGVTVSYRIRGEYWKSTWNVREVWSRAWVTTGNFWRTGICTNFQ